MMDSRIGVGVFVDGELEAFSFPHGGGYSVVSLSGKGMPQDLVDQIAVHASEKLNGYEQFVRERANVAHSTETLPTEVGQYLFAMAASPMTLWSLTVSGWFNASGVHYASPLLCSPFTMWQAVVRGTV